MPLEPSSLLELHENAATLTLLPALTANPGCYNFIPHGPCPEGPGAVWGEGLKVLFAGRRRLTDLWFHWDV